MRNSGAGLAGGLSTAVIVALLVLAIFRPREQAGALSLGCGALLGEISGFLAALL